MSADNPFRPAFRPLGRGKTEIIDTEGRRSSWEADLAPPPEPSTLGDSASAVIRLLSGRGTDPKTRA